MDMGTVICTAHNVYTIPALKSKPDRIRGKQIAYQKKRNMLFFSVDTQQHIG
jgi:hypothetical protein